MTDVPIDIVVLLVASLFVLAANVWFLRRSLYPRG